MNYKETYLIYLKTSFHDHLKFKREISEIKQLMETVGYQAKKVFTQTAQPRPKYFIGNGKIHEIKDEIKNQDIDKIFLGNIINSKQKYNLMTFLGLAVNDYVDLILDVFAYHAKTKEANLQIDLARLEKEVPFLKVELSEKVSTEHPGPSGAGERIYHNVVTNTYRRIKKIKKALDKIVTQRDLLRYRRQKKGYNVALAGYTNSGKTTLLNSLTNSTKLFRDELFTTLQAKTSKLKNSRNIFLTDTIGFIQNLPHSLIYPFKATLSEIAFSDLIMLVVDISDSLDI